jgi:hypothetical protein
MSDAIDFARIKIPDMLTKAASAHCISLDVYAAIQETPMTDTTHDPDDHLLKSLRNSKGWPTLGNAAADRIEELKAKRAQQDDLVQAAVAAALREAAALMFDDLWITADNDREEGYDEGLSAAANAILALITPDAQAALEAKLAAERERIADLERRLKRWEPQNTCDSGHWPIREEDTP